MKDGTKVSWIPWATKSRFRGGSVLGLLLAMAALLVAVAPAAAKETRVVASSFGGGELSLTTNSGVAVNDATHDVYVADTGHGRVAEFEPNGTPVKTFGTLSAPTFIAIDNSGLASQGAVYVVASGENKISKFSAAGTAESSWGVAGTISGSGPIAGIAVGPAGALYILEENSAIRRYSSASVAESAFEAPRGTSLAGLAVNSAGNLFKVDGTPEVTEFDQTGATISNDLTGRKDAVGLSIDPGSDALYVVNGDSGSASISVFANACGEVCTPQQEFGSGEIGAASGVAVDPTSHAVYAAGAGKINVFGPKVVVPDVTAEAASGVTGSKATLHGVVNPDGIAVTECKFEYGTTPALGNSKPCIGSIPSDEADHPVTASLTGLTIGSEYFFRLAAGNANGQNRSSGPSFETLRTVVTEPATSVSDSGAVLNGKVLPEGEAVEECFFEFGPSESYGASVPCQQTVPTDEGVHAVSATVTGLTAGGVAYHFRLVVKKAGGQTEGLDQEFVTTGPAIVYERSADVSADAATLTGSIKPQAGGPTSYYFEYGTTPSYGTSTPEFVTENEGLVAETITGLSPSTTYHWRLIASNSGGTLTGPDRVFTTRPSAPLPETDCPNQSLRIGLSANLPECRAYEMVSPVKKSGNVFPVSNPEVHGSCLDCAPGELAYAVPTMSSPSGNGVTFQGDPFTAGLASKPNQYRAFRGSDGWAWESLTPPQFFGYEEGSFQGISPSLERGVAYQFRTSQLSPDAPVGYANLYYLEPDDSFQALVTETPPIPGTSFEINFEAANAGAGASREFEEVIFSANAPLTQEVPGVAPPAPEVPGGERNLYQWRQGRLSLVNVLPGNTTAVAGAHLAAAHLAASGYRSAISADGSHVFWTAAGITYVRINGSETQEIQGAGEFAAASADGSRALLNSGCLYSVEDESCEYDLTEHEGGFLRELGASTGLSRIYFLDTAVLAGANSEGKSPVENQANLYLWENGSSTFIRTFPDLGSEYPEEGRPEARLSQVTNDGGYFAFQSVSQLTDYDNSGPCAGNFGYNVTDGLCSEVYVYAAASHQLSCVSCNPTGQTPIGISNLTLSSPFGKAVGKLPQAENLSTEGSGRIFFESQDALLPQDLNGKIRDVYEWRPAGVGGCEDAKGCLALISSGTGSTDAGFLASSPDGSNTFIDTRDQLLPQDKDEFFDIYDARVDGGFAQPGSPPCGGEEACRGATAAAGATAQTPGSSTFAGPGNEKPQQKHKKKHHKKKHHKKKHHKKHSTKHMSGGSK